MQNLLQSTDIATLFLDRDLRIKRFTTQAREVINLIPSDMGRPLADLAINVRYARLGEDAARVLDTLVSHEVEVQTTDGAWRLVRMVPYRTSQNVIDGVVITVVDIDRLKRAELMAASTAFPESLLELMPGPVLVLDRAFAVVAANHAFLETFGMARGDLVGRRLFDLPGKGFWASDAATDGLRSVVSSGRTLEGVEVEQDLPGKGPARLSLGIRRLEEEAGAAGHVLLTVDVIGASISR